MKMNADFSLDPAPYPNADSSAVVGLTPPPTRPGPGVNARHGVIADAPHSNGSPEAPPFDPWSFAEVLAKRWYLLVLGGLALGTMGYFAGLALWQNSYTATVQMIRHESPTAEEVLGDRRMSLQTFADLLRTPELVQRVSAASNPEIPPETLGANLRVTPERNSESLTIAVSASSPDAAAALANLYAQEAVQFTREMQARDAASMNDYLQQQLATIDSQIQQLDQQLRQFDEQQFQADERARQFDQQLQQIDQQLRDLGQEALRPGITAEASSPESLPNVMRSVLLDQLRTAQQELVNLLGQYTEANPMVQAQRIKVALLEAQFSENLPTPPTATPVKPPPPAPDPTTLAAGNSPLQANSASRQIDADVARNRVRSLDGARLPLAGRQRALQSLVNNPPGQLRVLIPAKAQNALKHDRKFKVIALTAFAAMMGIAGATALTLLVEVTDKRLKTVDDVRRVTHLPLIASLHNLKKMPQRAREQWAFHTWTALQSRLQSTGGRGFICGVASSTPGEGRTTWIRLLAQAASQRGFKVLTIATQSSSGNGEAHTTSAAFPRNDLNSGPASVVADVLASPGDVTRKLVGPHPQVVVHLTLPVGVWNVERRKQWQAALDHWRNIENVVIFIELPPASEPESIMLAEELPNLLWIADSGHTDAATTRAQLATLRNANCHLVGAVLNHAPSRPLRNRFSRWLPA